eukprot:6192422-Prymnesium_polylepis.2
MQQLRLVAPEVAGGVEPLLGRVEERATERLAEAVRAQLLDEEGHPVVLEVRGQDGRLEPLDVGHPERRARVAPEDGAVG